MTSTVSIIVPTYNCRPFVADAIRSVLGQTFAAHEIIVIDDGGTDGTDEVMRPFGSAICYVKQTNTGVSAARNRGIELSTGQWLLFLDADDLLPPNALRDLVACAARRKDCVIYGDRLEMAEDGSILREWPAKDCTGPPPSAGREHFRAAAFAPGSAIVPRALALDVGGFDATFSTCADQHFWIRCGAVAEFVSCNQVVFWYRDRPGSMSKDQALNASERVRVHIDALRWCEERNIQLFDHRPGNAELLLSVLRDVYYARRWKSVDALLALASELKIEQSEIDHFRRLRRIPSWIVKCRDKMDEALNSLPSGRK